MDQFEIVIEHKILILNETLVELNTLQSNDARELAKYHEGRIAAYETALKEYRRIKNGSNKER